MAVQVWMAGRECKGKVVQWVHLEAVGKEETGECQEPAIRALLVKEACQELAEAMVRRAEKVTEANLGALDSLEGLDQRG